MQAGPFSFMCVCGRVELEIKQISQKFQHRTESDRTKHLCCLFIMQKSEIEREREEGPEVTYMSHLSLFSVSLWYFRRARESFSTAISYSKLIQN